MGAAAKVFKMDWRDGRSQGWFDPPNCGPYDYQGVKPATAAIILTIGKRLLRGWLKGLNWMGCGTGIGMQVYRAGRWRCRIDDPVASFFLLYIKAYIVLALVFFVVVRHSALAFP